MPPMNFTGNESELGRRLAELTLALVQIPSVTGEERALSDWVEAFARAQPSRPLMRRFGNALIIQPRARVDAPAIGLFGHLDTVPPAKGQPQGIRDGKVYGRGAADMKAGLAWMLRMLEAPTRPVKARPILVFYDREEGPMDENGLIPLLEERRLPPLEVALVLEPTANRVEAGCSGSIHARVTITGEAAHSARPWLGRNALYMVRPLLDHLAGMERQPVRVGEMTYYEVMTVTQLATTNARNVIPPQIVLNVNYRFAPGKSTERAAQIVRQEVVRALGAGNVPEERVRVEIVDRAPAGADASAHPIIAQWRAERGLELSAKQGWTDVARLTEAGVAAVNFGPGDPREAHQSREWVSIASLVEGFEDLVTLFY